MSFYAKVIEDSKSFRCGRITSIQVRYPRFILPEVNTHRVFSRSSSSSRAIPVKKFLKMIKENPVEPLHWGKNQQGMQANEELQGADRQVAIKLWHEACENALNSATKMQAVGLHKQVANRVLEPFMWQETIITSTEWNNFFALRYHSAAQPEIGKIAELIYNAYEESTPKHVNHGQWHLPYITEEERELYDANVLCKASSARCARVSYSNHDGSNCDVVKDIRLFERLVGDVPKHASPPEHQATPSAYGWDEHLQGNFTGWDQFRKMIENENLTEFKVGMYE